MTPLERRLAAAHLRQLARAAGVTLVWVRSWRQAEASPRARVARVPRVSRARDYLVGLHELGHVLSPSARRLAPYEDSRRIACEAYAWAWAADNGLPQLIAAIPKRDWELMATQTIGSYVRWHAEAERP